MKIYRIVTDRFAGFEVQVKYSLFPFVWFQAGAYKGVNSWHTYDQALEFIRMKKMGYASEQVFAGGLLPGLDMEVKNMLSFNLLKMPAEIAARNFTAETQLSGFFRPAY
jgi:hypothetical protein